MAFEPRTTGDPATAKVPRKRAAARALEAAVAAEEAVATGPVVSPVAVTAPSETPVPTAQSPFGNTRPKRVRRPAGDPAEVLAATAAPEGDPASGGFAARSPRGRRTSTATTAAATHAGAPSVEEPATLLRDDRIGTSAQPRRRSAPAAPAAPAPLDAPPHVAVPRQAEPPAAAEVAPAPAQHRQQPASTPRAAAETLAPDPDLDASHEAVVIGLGGGRYGIPMDAVDEVGRPPSVTRVPGLPAWLAGVANWRGRVLAVVDLRPLLGAPQLPLGRTGRLVVCTLAGVTIGLVTEEVEGVVTVDRDSIEQPLVTLGGQAATLVAGQVTHARGPIALLELDAVFALRTQLPRARRAG
ncbi:MAG: hypothetical protein QOH99_1465 [Frankiaceae bacterium]|nr:hypothetical protein [Frankiaceae bacterium]